MNVIFPLSYQLILETREFIGSIFENSKEVIISLFKFDDEVINSLQRSKDNKTSFP